MNMLRRPRHAADREPQATSSSQERYVAATSLQGLPVGRSGSVAALAGGRELVARLAALGLTPGAPVEVAQNPGYGPVIVLVRGTRLVLGRGEAAQVLVVPVEAHDAGQVNGTQQAT